MYCHILRVRAIPTLESTDSMITNTKLISTKFTLVLFAAEVECSVEVGGRLPQEVVVVPQLLLQEQVLVEEEGGGELPQLEAEVVVPCPRQQEGGPVQVPVPVLRSLPAK